MTDIVEKGNDRGNRLLNLLQKRVPKYHPLIAMLEMSQEDNVDDTIKFNCHKEIAKYIEPTLKNVEVRADIKQDYGTLRVIRTERQTKSLEHKTKDDTLVLVMDKKEKA